MASNGELHTAQAVESVRIESELFTERLQAAGALGVRRRVRISAASAYDADGLTLRPLAEGEKRVHLIRHGQGFHNLLGDLYRQMGKKFDAATGEGGADNPYCRPEVVDPPLTEVGRNQAKALQPKARKLSPELIVVSPLVRATQTALIAFAHLLEAPASERVPFVAHEGCHEIAGVHTCDRRRSVDELRRDFPAIDYEATAVAQEDPLWSETEREPLPRLAERGYEFLLWIRSRPERDVAVASHFAWIFTALNAVIQCEDPKLSLGFLTGEMRSLVVRFEDVDEGSLTKRARTT